MGKVKIAAIQMVATFLDVDKNLENAELYIRQVAKSGAQVICLPEAFHVGYLLQHLDAMLSLAEPIDGISLTRMSRLARELQVWLIIPILYQKNNNQISNTAFVISGEGEIVGEYSKTHLLRAEETFFQRGNHYNPIETPFGKIGVMICNDLSFPEVSRLFALNGTEILFAPSAWQGMSYLVEWWDRCLTARALDNQFFVAAVNLAGQSTSGFYAGNSKLINPRGDTMAKLGMGEEQFVCEIDTDDIAIERAYNTSFFDRHPEDYLPLTY